jgi:hypothetical protein
LKARTVTRTENALADKMESEARFAVDVRVTVNLNVHASLGNTSRPKAGTHLAHTYRRDEDLSWV